MSESAENISDNSKRTFGPLSFEELSLETYISKLEQECMLCDEKFALKTQIDLFLKHLFEIHNLIIEEFQEICRFDKYVFYWKQKFAEKSIENLIPSVKIEGTQQYYFILSILLKDDKEIRHKLKLENALEQQQLERTTIFRRNCLFCKLEFEGKCFDYIKHLSMQHNLQLGKAENLVFVTEFLDFIEEKLNKLNCIYCEKTFVDRNTLKEHMRKKLHKRINPSNNFYDKFYIVNYLEIDKNWQHIQKEDDNLPINLHENSDEEWDDWNENDQEIVCLFCNYKDLVLHELCDHMKVLHHFPFQCVISELEYYQRVKLINYIRRQLHINQCTFCGQQFDDKDLLQNHMRDEKHCKIPDLKIFDQPEYYFPTYENDALLYYLDEILDCELVNT